MLALLNMNVLLATQDVALAMVTGFMTFLAIKLSVVSQVYFLHDVAAIWTNSVVV